MIMEETRFQQHMAKAEVIAGLRHALDSKYRQICEVARHDWERLFRGKDPTDACVNVRVAVTPSSATRGSGFLKSRRQSNSRPATKRLPRFAQ
jgi:hypothetical protein